MLSAFLHIAHMDMICAMCICVHFSQYITQYPQWGCSEIALGLSGAAVRQFLGPGMEHLVDGSLLSVKPWLACGW